MKLFELELIEIPSRIKPNQLLFKWNENTVKVRIFITEGIHRESNLFREKSI